MEMSAWVLPRLTVLTQEQIELVHLMSLSILSQIGVRVDSVRARKLFAAADEAVFIENDRVAIKPELVEWAIQSSPGTVDIFNRSGSHAFCLGNEPTRFGIGVTNLYYQDPKTDEVKVFTRKLLESAVKLGDALPCYDIVSTVGILRDVEEEKADLYATLEMAANTTKPMVILVSDEKQFIPVLDMLEYISGDLASKPFVIPYLNPLTPLVINEGTADKLLDAIGRGLPIIYSNYGMAGASTPITPAGALTLLNAELLAGLVLSQLAKPGTPIILGSLPAFFDMREMVDFYDPQTMLLNLACAEMMEFYKIPHAGTSGSGNGWGADLIASSGLWINHLTSVSGKSGLAPFVGGCLNSKVFSPTMAVYASEIIEQSRQFAQGFALSSELVAFDEIEEIGPGGNFLGSPQTLARFRDAYHKSKIFPRLSLEKWEERDRPKADQLLREKTERLIVEQSPPEDTTEILSKGEAFISKF